MHYPMDLMFMGAIVLPNKAVYVNPSTTTDFVNDCNHRYKIFFIGGLALLRPIYVFDNLNVESR